MCTVRTHVTRSYWCFMARNRHSRRRYMQRDVHPISTLKKFTNPVLHPIVIKPRNTAPVISDRRWKRQKFQPPRTTRGSLARIRAKISPFMGVTFHLPKRAVICLRRKMRREVLFALKRTGKGAGAKHRHRNHESNYRC